MPPAQADPEITGRVLPCAASVAFGQRLRKLRGQHGLSQDGLARRTDIHPTAIARMERGAREPRLRTILRLAQGLDIQPGMLLDELTYAQATAPRART
jgi:transcriptional regulator with XRE-family HTH domain